MQATSWVHYFAYGSNMLTSRLRKRTPTAQVLGHARLEHWHLRFDKRSQDGTGKCHIMPRLNHLVHGVLFKLHPDDIKSLDRAEGRGFGYNHHHLEVTLAACGTRHSALTYVADSRYMQPGLRPMERYHGLVIAGAEEHGLPAEYVAMLRAVRCVSNPC